MRFPGADAAFVFMRLGNACIIEDISIPVNTLNLILVFLHQRERSGLPECIENRGLSY
jgi:hypothetical protein